MRHAKQYKAKRPAPGTEPLQPTCTGTSGPRDQEAIDEVIREWIVPVLVKAFLTRQAGESFRKELTSEPLNQGEAVSGR